MPRVTGSSPCCGRTLDGATCADGSQKKPKAGDVSVCMYCQAVLFFRADGTLRRLNTEEMGKLSPDERDALIAVVMTIEKLNENRARERRGG
jgi:hypothetical protein